MALFFPSSSSPSSFPWMRRDASCHYDISNLAGKTKKREKKATDRWRPGGWHSNVPPCLRRSTKDAGASEGNWKMTRREKERHGDESKGVDVGNQPVVEEEGGGGCSKRPRERERGGVVACAREKGSRGRRWRRKREREREMGSGAVAEW